MIGLCVLVIRVIIFLSEVNEFCLKYKHYMLNLQCEVTTAHAVSTNCSVFCTCIFFCIDISNDQAQTKLFVIMMNRSGMKSCTIVQYI